MQRISGFRCHCVTCANMDVAGESNNEVKLRRDAGQRVFYSSNGPKYLRTGCEEGNGTELTYCHWQGDQQE